MKKSKYFKILLMVATLSATLAACSSKSNKNAEIGSNDSENEKDNIEKLVDLSKILVASYGFDVVEDYLNEGFQYLKEAEEESIWYKDCEYISEVKKTTRGVEQEEYEYTDFLPIKTSEKSIWVTAGAYRGPLMVNITVWGTSNGENLREQLKHLGYTETANDYSGWDYKKTEDDMPQVSLTKKDGDVYTLSLVGDGVE